MTQPGPPTGRAPRGWRPAEALRRLLRRGTPTVDYEFALLSRAGYSPATPPASTMAPTPQTALNALRHQVTKLAGNGCLDEGSGRVFDQTIGSWVDEWTNQIDHEHDARQNVLRQREVHAAANLARVRTEREQVLRRLAEAEADVRALLDDPEPTPSPPPTPDRIHTR